MSSRLRIFIEFLRRSQSVNRIAQASKLSKPEVAGRILFLWDFILENGQQSLDFNALAALWGIPPLGVSEFCRLLAAQGFGTCLTTGFEALTPCVRCGELRLNSVGGKGGVSLKPMNSTTKLGKNPPNPPDERSIAKCKVEWATTMRHFGITRQLGFHDEVDIARALQRYGCEMVVLAIIGARYEAETDSFKPSQHVSLRRVLDRERIEKFSNLGSQELERKRKSVQNRGQSQAAQFIDESLKRD